MCDLAFTGVATELDPRKLRFRNDASDDNTVARDQDFIALFNLPHDFQEMGFHIFDVKRDHTETMTRLVNLVKIANNVRSVHARFE
jgi:hypothetical protein